MHSRVALILSIQKVPVINAYEDADLILKEV